MKKLATLSLLLLLGVGCTVPETLPTIEEVDEAIFPTMEDMTQPRIYVSFIQNVHDWVFPEQSLETLHRLIDLHEQYEVPVDLYLEDHVVHPYLELDPTIFDRFRESAFVTISYHIRPPHPVYEGFDTIDLAAMSVDEQYEVLLNYETHRLDLETGGYLDEPGGYAYLADLIGYPPRVVTHTSSRAYGEALSRVYEELGALFTVVHGRESTLDQMIRGLHLRPEQVEVKLYEESYAKGFNVEDRFAQWTSGFDGTQDYFINLKYHENNYYTQGTPFGPVYWNQTIHGKDLPKSPPYDLSQGEKQTNMKSISAQEEQWQIYEETVRYVAEHSSELMAITSKDLEEMLDQ